MKILNKVALSALLFGFNTFAFSQAPTSLICPLMVDMNGLPVPYSGLWQSDIGKLFSECPSVKVGIGNTAPRTLLDVWGGAYVNNLCVGGADPSNVSSRAFYMRAPYSTTNPPNHPYNLEKIFTVEANTNTVFDMDRSGMVRINSPFTSSINKTVFLVENDDRKLLQIENNGLVRAREIKVDLATNWPDYVFEKEYKLKPLSYVKTFVDENGHLPGVPSAEKIKEDGIPLGEMNRILLEKVEELTLYLLEQDEKIKALESKVNNSGK